MGRGPRSPQGGGFPQQGRVRQNPGQGRPQLRPGGVLGEAPQPVLPPRPPGSQCFPPGQAPRPLWDPAPAVPWGWVLLLPHFTEGKVPPGAKPDPWSRGQCAPGGRTPVGLCLSLGSQEGQAARSSPPSPSPRGPGATLGALGKLFCPPEPGQRWEGRSTWRPTWGAVRGSRLSGPAGAGRRGVPQGCACSGRLGARAGNSPPPPAPAAQAVQGRRLPFIFIQTNPEFKSRSGGRPTAQK